MPKSYKPPLEILAKNKATKPAAVVPKGPGEDSKISMFTLSYRIKGMALGLIVAVVYCLLFLHAWSVKYLIAGPIVGVMLGWIAGRFFYRSDK